MITIGLTTFSDHPALIDGASRKVRLTEYSGHFQLWNWILLFMHCPPLKP
ncbi:hypothetical protein [Lentilactobacillus senioris]